MEAFETKCMELISGLNYQVAYEYDHSVFFYGRTYDRNFLDQIELRFGETFLIFLLPTGYAYAKKKNDVISSIPNAVKLIRQSIKAPYPLLGGPDLKTLGFDLAWYFYSGTYSFDRQIVRSICASGKLGKFCSRFEGANIEFFDEGSELGCCVIGSETFDSAWQTLLSCIAMKK